MLEDYFFADPKEPDHNYPTPPTIATHVGLDDSDALYIYVPRGNMPPSKHRQYAQRIAEEFKTAFPGRTILAGGDDLKFTTISKKQEFKGKLDGSLLNDD
jgi:hypothetical protein